MSLFDELYNLFRAETLQDAMYQAGLKMGAAAEAQVSEYPPQTHAPLPVQYTRTGVRGNTFQSKFKTRQQQGKVFVLIAAGAIPYIRSGQLGRSITSDVENVTPSEVLVSIGTNVGYAPLVIGDPATEQSPYHKGNWTPLQVDMARGEDTIMQAGLAGFFTALEKGL